MSDNTQMTVLPEGILAESKYGSDKQFEMVAKQSLFLPRIQLFNSSSNLCKKGKLQIGVYAVVQNKDTILAELTSSFSCIVLGWRPKAIRIDGDDTKAFYNPVSQTFKSIEEDAKKKVMGALFGPEYLVYVPDRKIFAAFFFGNPTMRRAAPDMKALIGKVALIRSTLIEKKKYTWHGPVIGECSTPVPMPTEGSEEYMELATEMKEQVALFNAPPEEELEEAGDSVADDRAR